MTAPRVAGLHHLAVKARDVAALASFYRDVLGLAGRAEHRDERGLRSVWLELGPSLLMVERSDAPAPAASTGGEDPFAHDPPGLHLLALSIPAGDRARWRERLAEAGCPVLRESDFTLYALDPEGNRLGLSTWPERSR